MRPKGALHTPKACFMCRRHASFAAHSAAPRHLPQGEGFAPVTSVRTPYKNVPRPAAHLNISPFWGEIFHTRKARISPCRSHDFTRGFAADFTAALRATFPKGKALRSLPLRHATIKMCRDPRHTFIFHAPEGRASYAKGVLHLRKNPLPSGRGFFLTAV